jgi:hypothetical protein
MAPTFPRDVFLDMFLAGTWRELTTAVDQEKALKIKRGRGSEQGEVAPGTLACTLINTAGDFTVSNPLGQWYGEMGQGVPLRFGLTVAEDTFTGRTVANGWGTATTGEVWSIFTGMGSAADYAVSGGVGTHSIGAANTYRYSYLDIASFSYRDIEVVATVTVAINNITGGSIEPANVLCRHQGGSGAYYYARVSVDASEALTISIHHSLNGQLVTPVAVPGLVDAVSSKVLRAKIQAEGQTIRAKVYAPGAEPLDWQVSVHDTAITTGGGVGVRNGVAAGNTNTTPIVFTMDNIEVRNIRFAGEIVELKPRWNATHTYKTAELTASTVLRRIRQGKTPLKSTLRRAYLADSIDLPVQYWPCEEGADAQQISSAIDSNAMIFFADGRPRFGASTDFIGSAPLPKVNGSQWVGVIAPYAATGETQFRFLIAVPADGIPDNASVAWFETSGTLRVWELRYRTGGGMSLDIYNDAGTKVLTGGSVALALNGALVRVSLELTQNGANVDWGLSGYDVITGVAGGSSGSQAGTFVVATKGIIGPRRLSAPVNDVGLGHIVTQANVTSIFELSSEYGAWRGETPVDRLLRLGVENGFGAAYVGSSSRYPMGPQLPAVLSKLLTECQDAAQGTLADSRMSGNTLTMRTMNATFAQASRLTLDYSAKMIAPPIEPDADDRPISNDITAKRLAGGEYRTFQATGPANIQDPGSAPGAVGRYDDQVPVNVRNESQLPDVATWALHLGTTLAERFPKVVLKLTAAGLSALQGKILDLDLDDRFTMTTLNAADYYGDIDLLVRGYAETYNTAFEHVIEINCAPYEPHNVGIYDDSGSRYGAATSTLAGALTSSATSFSVNLGTDPAWTTTAGQFPMDVMVGGERIRLSGISGTGPQTFTVATSGRAINGVVKAHNAGDAVTVAPDIYYGR